MKFVHLPGKIMNYIFKASYETNNLQSPISVQKKADNGAYSAADGIVFQLQNTL
jgi:hypothetical protein